MKKWFRVIKEIIVEDIIYRVGSRILLDEEDAKQIRGYIEIPLEYKDKQIKAYKRK